MKPYVVEILVNLPTDDKTVTSELQLTYLFESQPTVQNIKTAIDRDLFLGATEDFEKVQAYVHYGLDTWGVPILRDHPEQKVGVHRVATLWVANVFSVEDSKSHYNVRYGAIAVQRKVIYPVGTA